MRRVSQKPQIIFTTWATSQPDAADQKQTFLKMSMICASTDVIFPSAQYAFFLAKRVRNRILKSNARDQFSR